jgi:signal transduction histidine kinase
MSSQQQVGAHGRVTRVDVATAALLAVSSAFLAALGSVSQVVGFRASMGLVVLASFLVALPLVWRRRAPVPVVALCSVGYAVAAELGVMELWVSQVVLFLAFYSVGVWEPDRVLAHRARLVTVVAMALWLASSAVRGFSDAEVGERGVSAYFALLAVQVAINAAYFGAGWYFGDRTWARAREREQLVAAEEEIRAQQDRLTEQAVALERLRIARELHDVVAHHVSAMGIQAGAARRVLTRDPEQATHALGAVEASARSAIAELGTMVGALRSQDDAEGPMPTLADLEELLASARASGPVELEVVGEPRSLTGVVELTVYRVVQEALTNVRKHAGAQARADVRIRYRSDDVEVEIADDGRGPSVPTAGLGMGQIGMRERISAVGGSLETGPKSRGGYLVRARIPSLPRPELPAAAGVPSSSVPRGAAVAGERA